MFVELICQPPFQASSAWKCLSFPAARGYSQCCDRASNCYVNASWLTLVAIQAGLLSTFKLIMLATNVSSYITSVDNIDCAQRQHSMEILMFLFLFLSSHAVRKKLLSQTDWLKGSSLYGNSST